MVTDGAEAILAPTLDAKLWTARQHLQHAELFRHRAAENHRWIAVAASSGLTQIIDPYGNRIQSAPLMEATHLLGHIEFNSNKTFYTRYGWALGYICTTIATLLLVTSLIMHYLKQKPTD